MVLKERDFVVYLLIPTSNHNSCIGKVCAQMLYIFWFLHQTTTLLCCHRYLQKLYIFWFLHQTTTSPISGISVPSCISFDSYIKPQPGDALLFLNFVVYLLIPTSNHNGVVINCIYLLLYIFWFLHQTTTHAVPSGSRARCISFDSYIKPQLIWYTGMFIIVVYLLIPTSNHNQDDASHLIHRLYIFWFLHQTTTRRRFSPFPTCCISFDSYIKPQPPVGEDLQHEVVYLLIPTSNHNQNRNWLISSMLYIFWFLHQTTTCGDMFQSLLGLYIFWFLHQTTTSLMMKNIEYCCISFDSYIKPQPNYSSRCSCFVVYLLIPTSNHNTSLCTK